MTVLNVRHTTTYRYSRPVALGDHRMMLRPRDSHDLRLIKTNLTFSPQASVHWMHDVFGNSIAVASFSEPAAELRIESSLMLETFAAERPAFQITRDAENRPASEAVTHQDHPWRFRQFIRRQPAGMRREMRQKPMKP